jgi:hypothetical protein
VGSGGLQELGFQEAEMDGFHTDDRAFSLRVSGSLLEGGVTESGIVSIGERGTEKDSPARRPASRAGRTIAACPFARFSSKTGRSIK